MLNSLCSRLLLSLCDRVLALSSIDTNPHFLSLVKLNMPKAGNDADCLHDTGLLVAPSLVAPPVLVIGAWLVWRQVSR